MLRRFLDIVFDLLRLPLDNAEPAEGAALVGPEAAEALPRTGEIEELPAVVCAELLLIELDRDLEAPFDELGTHHAHGGVLATVLHVTPTLVHHPLLVRQRKKRVADRQKRREHGPLRRRHLLHSFELDATARLAKRGEEHLDGDADGLVVDVRVELLLGHRLDWTIFLDRLPHARAELLERLVRHPRHEEWGNACTLHLHSQH